MFSLLVAASVSSLVAQADEVGIAYTSCMFAAAREVPLDASNADLLRKLESSCTDLREEMHYLMVEIRQRKFGRSAQEAEQDWRSSEYQGIMGILQAFETRKAIAAGRFPG